jgi:predicted DNA-binding transcriptional regulator AlpA
MGRLGKKKRRAKRTASQLGTMAGLNLGLANVNPNDFIPGPKLRAKLGISAVTLWRWRHDEASGFPAPKVIKGRLYFPAGAVSAWLDKQPEAP